MSRTCEAEGCAEKLTGNANQKYHDETCRNREAKRRYRARNKVEILDNNRIKRGDAYATLEDNPQLVEMLERNEISQKELAALVGVSRGQFSTVYATYLMDQSVAEASAEWEMSEEMRKMLMLEEWEYDPDRFTLDHWLDLAVAGFVAWRAKFHKTKRGRYFTKDFHKEWIKETLRAIITGGRTTILSPPRHGKTELMIHFIEWMVSRDPEFACMWIGPNESIAKLNVAAVRKTFEENTELRKATLPPGRTWEPQGRNKTSWGNLELTVANRDPSITNKAPTLVAVGRGGGVLSRDVDLIITDDIEDFKSTKTEEARTSTRDWMFNDVESRKEEFTAWLNIGSRQHPDDVHEHLIEDPEWSVIINAAHDESCGNDPDDLDAHVSCMLFPELRTYRWLMGKRRSAESKGQLANYEMIYLNDPRPQGMVVFSEDAIERAKNKRRGLGIEGMIADVQRRTDREPHEVPAYHLIAGLDPSATNYQAAFLWAWVGEIERLYCIDIDNRKGGGIYAALDLFWSWSETYELRHWVWENNIMTEEDLLQNPDVRAFIDETGTYLEPHNTQGGNKNNPLYGVGAMSGLYEDGLVDLPWGTEAARQKVHMYARQMVRFVDSAETMRRHNRKTDILMASWFPMKAIRRFRSEHSAEVVSEEEMLFETVDADLFDFDEVPW